MPLSPGMCWLPMPPAMVNPRPLEPLNSSTSISSSVWVIPWELGYLRRLMARTTLFPARFKASTDTEWLTLTTDTSFTWNKLTTDVKKLPRHCYNFGKIEAKLTSWNLSSRTPFSKWCNSKKDRDIFMKPTTGGHKYPWFSMKEAGFFLCVLRETRIAWKWWNSIFHHETRFFPPKTRISSNFEQILHYEI